MSEVESRRRNSLNLQKQILKYYNSVDYSPTHREVTEKLGLSTHGSATHHINKLIKYGHLYKGSDGITHVAKAGLSRILGLMDWQPIETAPKDGEEVLLLLDCHGKYRVDIGFYSRRRERWICTGAANNCKKWMPMPKVPRYVGS